MPPRKTCGKRGGKRIRRGGSELTALRLDPYYLKRLRGKGIKEWFQEKFGKTDSINAIDQEILHDLQYGIEKPKQPETPSSKTPSSKPTGRRVVAIP